MKKKGAGVILPLLDPHSWSGRMNQRLSVGQGSDALTAAHVRRVTVGLLGEHLPLGLHGARYANADILHVVVAAATPRRSLTRACAHMCDAPRATLVRASLGDCLFARQDRDAREGRRKTLLVARLPPDLPRHPHPLALDLTVRPDDGKAGLAPDQLRRGEAQAGTTRFPCAATASVRRAGRRVTLALTFVHAHEARVDVLEDLLGRIARRGVSMLRLFLDREVASVAIVRQLAAPPFPAIVALPTRGARHKAVLTGRGSAQTTDTIRSADDGELPVPRAVACRSAAGRRGRHGSDELPFAVVGHATGARRVRQVARASRPRFGIESGYRPMHAVRVPTTSRDPAPRRVLVAVALLRTNLWVWLNARVLAATPPHHHPRARAWRDDALRLTARCDLLSEAIKARDRLSPTRHYPFPLLTSPKL